MRQRAPSRGASRRTNRRSTITSSRKRPSGRPRSDYLFGLLGEALDGGIPAELTGVDVSQVASAFADGIRRFVRFAAEHPELNQIMVHEGTAASDRLAWMTETHVKPVFDGIRPAWQMLRKAGVAAPIDHEILYYVLVGAASLPYVNAPEVRLLTGRNPNDPKWIDAHAAVLIAILLPGWAARADSGGGPPRLRILGRSIFRWWSRVLLLHGYSDPGRTWPDNTPDPSWPDGPERTGRH